MKDTGDIQVFRDPDSVYLPQLVYQYETEKIIREKREQEEQERIR